MDIQTRANVQLEGSGFALLPELEHLYLANGGCISKSMIKAGTQQISKIVFVDCTQNIEKPSVQKFYPGIACVAVINHSAKKDLLPYLRLGYHAVIESGENLIAQLSAIDKLIKGELCYSSKVLSDYIYESNNIYSGSVVDSFSFDVTRKERTVVDCVVKGMSNQEIAEALAISPNTVKMHLQNIYRKNNLKGKFHLISSCQGVNA